jgi:SAM-dependent methyltransferase
MTSVSSLPSQLDYWNAWHRINRVSESGPDRQMLAGMFLKSLPRARPCTVLDLGCGRGKDSLRFALEGIDVHAVDFSNIALNRARRAAGRHPDACVRFLRHDITVPLPFPNGYFSGVYSHLSLHYFEDLVTQRIFGEISRTISANGVLGFSVKSTADSYYGQGTLIEPDMFCRKGHVRHFFSADYTRRLLRDWKILVLDEYTGRYADGGTSSFIRVIAKKILT